MLRLAVKLCVLQNQRSALNAGQGRPATRRTCFERFRLSPDELLQLADALFPLLQLELFLCLLCGCFADTMEGTGQQVSRQDRISPRNGRGNPVRGTAQDAPSSSIASLTTGWYPSGFKM